ncbi:MAG: helix-turn-helix transcriptional regulator [Cytophagaceae bacterium]|jgi:AraC-like DNA-binding protein|nr:helix-turn-helix transcriptional regulator [Cytophagaceae bacterium]
MIAQHRQFELKGKSLIEKLQIQDSLQQRPVFQNEACFIYVKDGHSKVISSSENIWISSGEGLVLQCGKYVAQLLQNTSDKACEVYVIHLYPEILKEIYQEEIPSFIKSPATQHTEKLIASDVLQQFIQSLDFYFEHPQLVSPDLLRLKLKELILLLLETREKYTLLELFHHLFTPRQVGIAEVVQAHVFTQVSLEQLAFLAGHSVSTFKRAFKKLFNNTPANYIREQRMKRATELLLVSDLSISEISYRVGYEDSSHFSRVFHRTFRCSPSEFRESASR